MSVRDVPPLQSTRDHLPFFDQPTHAEKLAARCNKRDVFLWLWAKRASVAAAATVDPNNNGSSAATWGQTPPFSSGEKCPPPSLWCTGERGVGCSVPFGAPGSSSQQKKHEQPAPPRRSLNGTPPLDQTFGGGGGNLESRISNVDQLEKTKGSRASVVQIDDRKRSAGNHNQGKQAVSSHGGLASGIERSGDSVDNPELSVEYGLDALEAVFTQVDGGQLELGDIEFEDLLSETLMQVDSGESSSDENLQAALSTATGGGVCGMREGGKCTGREDLADGQLWTLGTPLPEGGDARDDSSQGSSDAEMCELKEGEGRSTEQLLQDAFANLR